MPDEGQQRLAAVQQLAAGHLDDIRACFRQPARITLLVRRPGLPDQDFVMTDDDLAEVAAMIERRRKEASDG